jgi:hypothetical protein
MHAKRGMGCRDVSAVMAGVVPVSPQRGSILENGTHIEHQESRIAARRAPSGLDLAQSI